MQNDPTTSQHQDDDANDLNKDKLPVRFYLKEWGTYTAYAFVAGAVFGAFKGYRAVKKVKIPEDKLNSIRERLYSRPSLSESATENVDLKRTLDLKHIVTASAIQNSVRYGINLTLLASTYFATDSILRYNFVLDNVEPLKSTNYKLNTALLPDKLRSVVPEEKYLATHNIIHKGVAGAASGMVAGGLASIGSGGILSTMAYTSGVGLALGLVTACMMIPFQNAITMVNFQQLAQERQREQAKVLEEKAIEQGLVQKDLRTVIEEENVFLTELDKIRDRLDILAEQETNAAANRHQRQQSSPPSNSNN